MFSDKRIRDALEAGKVGVWRWDVSSDRLEWSPNLESIHRLVSGSFKGDFTSFSEDIHADDRQQVLETIESVVRSGGDYHIEYRLPVGADGEERWIEAKGSVVLEYSAPTEMLGVCQDITSRKNTERELELRLAQQEVVAQLGKLALELDDVQELFERAVRDLAETLQLEFSKVLELQPDGRSLLLRAGVGWAEGLVGAATVSAGLESQAGFTLMSSEPVIVQDMDTETRFSGPPLLHEHGVAAGMSTIVVGPNGKPYGVLGVYASYPRAFSQYDVNLLQSVANILGSAVQKRHAQDIQHLLYRELRHRVGNLFAQLLSIHTQTARRADDIGELSEKFGERVQALARAHELISRGGWSSTSLDLLLRTLLEPYGGDAELEGPPVELPADQAFALSLAVNELITNAAKYGCLTKAGGQLRVSWRRMEPRDGDRIELDWMEICNEPVAASNGGGFGSRLIDAVFRQQLGGELERTHGDKGVRVRAAFTVTPVEPDEITSLFAHRQDAPASANG